MSPAAFTALRDQVRNGTFERDQLVELLGDCIARVCRWDEPEVEAVQQDLAEAHEALENAVADAEAREARFDGPDPCDVARDAAIAEAEAAS